jgi:hypothetical protein
VVDPARHRPGLQPKPSGRPPALAVRLAWEAVPGTLRQRAEDYLAGRVTDAVTQPGGFTPGAAARLRLADGRRVFAKAVGPEPNPDYPLIYRAEARITAGLPPAAPVPRLLEFFEQDGWVMLLFEDIGGRLPAEPWVPAELGRVLDALAVLAGILTPAPAGVAARPAGERLGAKFRGWRLLAVARDSGDSLAGLDPWAHRNLARLAGLESWWEQAAQGGSLVHADMRADNLLLTDDRVYFVDWPLACLAQPWFDLVTMLPSIAMQGGPSPEMICQAHPVTKAADPGAVTAVLAAVTGYYIRQSRQPPPPGMPTVRQFQHAVGQAALDWLRQRTRWR